MIKRIANYFSPIFDHSNSMRVADSQKGKRDENQDNYLLLSANGHASYLQHEREQTTQVAHWHHRYYRLAVADGMGGHQNGRQISEALIQELIDLKPQKSPQQLRDAIYIIHKHLWGQFAQYGAKSPGTTLVMADVHDSGKATIATIGDSRAFLWRDEQWQQLTHDQSLDEYDWRDGELDDADYDPDYKSHRLAQAMGYGSFGLIKDDYDFKPRQLNKKLRLDLAEELVEGKKDHADVFQLRLEKGEALLLASDGLWSVDDGKKALNLPSPSLLAQQNDLRDFLWRVIGHGGSDNLTVVMLWSKA